MSGPRVDEPVPCGDPECLQVQPSAQPETDGDLLYYACPCGYEFGYQQVRQGEGTCAAGLPESVRHAVSFAPAQDQQAGQPVFIGTIGRRPQ